MKEAVTGWKARLCACAIPRGKIIMAASKTTQAMKINLKAILSSIVTAVSFSVGAASTYADNDLFASINGGRGNGARFLYQYTPARTQSTFLSGLTPPPALAFGPAGKNLPESTAIVPGGYHHRTAAP